MIYLPEQVPVFLVLFTATNLPGWDTTTVAQFHCTAAPKQRPHPCCAGADSLAGDRLGVFNLSNQGHAACHKFMASFQVPACIELAATVKGSGHKIVLNQKLASKNMAVLGAGVVCTASRVDIACNL